MADTYSTNLVLTLMEEGAHNNDWGSYLNEALDTIDEKLGDTTSIATTGGNTTLTSTQEIVATILVSGTLVSAANIIFSGRGGIWCIRNACAGNYAVTCKVSGQTGVVIPANTECFIRCNGTDIFFASRPPTAIGTGTLCPHTNLYVDRTSVTAMSVTADALVLFDANGRARKITSVSLAINITSSGANGLDTGGEGSSTWYHLWVLAKEDGTVCGVLSASASAPTLPSGYTYYGYVGAVYNNSASDLAAMTQRNGEVSAASRTINSALTATSVTLLSVSAFVPPTAKVISVRGRIESTSGTGTVYLDVYPDSSGDIRSFRIVRYRGDTAADYVQQDQAALMRTAQTIYYNVAGIGATCFLEATGWRY